MKKLLLIMLLVSIFIDMFAQQAVFTYDQPSKCTPSTVGFTNTSTGNPVGHKWDFGDGFTSSNANPTHPYTSPGIYTVRYIVFYPNNVSDTAVQSVEVLNLPSFSFTKLNDSVCPGGSVSFTSSVSYPVGSNAIRSYSWDFGDGGFGSSANPVYQYINTPNQPVLYHVSLIVTDTNGCSQKVTQSDYIYVKAKPMPEFSVDKQYFCISDTPGIVHFTNQTSVTTNNTYSWIFSDGGSSTLENPVYSFSKAGSYAVSLSATSPEGCSNIISKPNLIEILNLKVQKTISDTILCSVPNDVTFTGLNGASVNYTWSFGDGESGEAIRNIITHTYKTSGTYLATVIANYRNGTCFAYDTVTIHVYDSINARMLIMDSLMCDYEYDSSVLFKNISPYPSADDFGFGSTVWLFGDSTTATGDPVSHVYNNDTDRYSVTMQTITPYGCVLEEITGNIWYHSYTPLKRKELIPFSGCVPLTVNMEFEQYSWDIPASKITCDWGDGSPLEVITLPIIVPPSHTYTDTGIFFVYTTYTNAIGCTYTDTIGMVRTGIPPTVWFTFGYKEQCFGDFFSKSPLFVQAFDSLDVYGNPVAGVSANKWMWLDRNKQPLWLSSADTALLRADDTGYIRISVVPYFNECPGDTITMDTVAYACPPAIGFTLNEIIDETGLVFCGYPVQITANNLSRGATGYKWFFGDAENLENQSTSTAQNPTFEYSQSNPFLFDNGSKGIRITLVGYNDDSINVYSPTYNRCKFCIDTVLRNIYIAEGIPDFISDPGICQGNTVYFYDSGSYNVSVSKWEFELFAQDTSNHEYANTKFPLPTDTTYINIRDGYPLVFNNIDNYMGILKITDNFNCEYKDTLHFSIYPQSIASFTSAMNGVHFTNSRDTLCANNPDTLYFRDASYTVSPFDTAEIVEWLWKLHQDTSSLQNPALVDRIPGLHDVELHIVNEYGCVTDSLFKNQILVNEITPIFYPSKNVYCNHTEVEFNNLSFISPYDYNKNTKYTCTWDFGDGSPLYTQAGTEKTAYHTYHLPNVPDTLYVTLTISTDERPCSASYTGPIIITGPEASFTDEGHRFPCPDQGRKVQFHTTSTGNLVWYYWHFGDSISGTANESNLEEPVHDYLKAGSYDIIHVVKDSDGCIDSIVVPKHVFIDGPIGSFQYGELSGCVDHRVVFIPSVTNTDSIIVNPDRASPIMKGGTNLNDSLFHTYQIPGAYLPYFYLYKWTESGDTLKMCVVEWAATDTVYAIDITPDFETDSLYCSLAPIVFPNTTTSSPEHLALDSVRWSFGNGDSLTAFEGHTQYNTMGTYTINMTAYIKGCSKQISKSIEIIELSETIHTGPDSVTSCQNDVNVLFTADSTATVDFGMIEYRWVFNDGDTIEGNPVSKTFASSGTYPYRVIVSAGMFNCIKTYFDTIIVYADSFPVAEFEANPQTVNYGEAIQFTDQSSPGKGAITSWYWDFGDTVTTHEQNPSHTYVNSSGYFTVLLKIENEFGCRDSIEHEVLVLESLEFPNLFTPVGSDGQKYVFKPLEEKGYFEEFQIDIYNRFGSSIWRNACKGPNCPDYSDAFWWDGYTKRGQLVEDGVYYWVVYAKPLSGAKPIIRNGSVTVIHSVK
jgi:PKD repeat protein